MNTKTTMGWLVVVLVLGWLGVSTTEAATRYVVKNNPGAQAPYTTWATAARDIQTAIDAAWPQDLILVSNGVYDTGGRLFGSVGGTNRVVLTNGVTVRAVNGAAVTAIVGRPHTAQTNDGPRAVRCVYMESGTTLEGFTLRNGHSYRYNYSGGGGALCQSTSARLNHVVVSDCSSDYRGGGVLSGTISNGVIRNNRSRDGGGVSGSTLFNCLVYSNTASENGGGIYNSARVVDCTVYQNTARYGGGIYEAGATRVHVYANSAQSGGGTYRVNLTDSLIYSNRATESGGGVVNGVISNCVIKHNSAVWGGGGMALPGSGNNSLHVIDSTVVSNRAGWGGGLMKYDWDSFFEASYLYATASDISFNYATNHGGGVQSATAISRCTVYRNQAGQYGGGAFRGRLYNSLVESNAASAGGGTYEAGMGGCTVVKNTATTYGGGSYGGDITGSIIYYNQAAQGANWMASLEQPSVRHVCSTPLPPGTNNISAAPGFINLAAGNYRLLSWSPCIDRGWVAHLTDRNLQVDMDGYWRHRMVAWDMGAYEYVVAPTRVIQLSGDLFFDDTRLGFSSTRYMVISNSGNAALTVTNLSLPAGFHGSFSGILGSGQWQRVAITFIPTVAGAHDGVLKVNCDKTAGIDTMLCRGMGVQSVINNPQSAYPNGAAWLVPGSVECEDFDRGGAGIAYSDATAANEGGAYRAGEQVDIAAQTSAANGHGVGWTRAGEWLEYTLNVGAAGTYSVLTRVAAAGAGGAFRLEANGRDVSGSLAVPDTGSWTTYQGVLASGLQLPQGVVTVRLVMVTNGRSGFVGSFDRMTFTAGVATPEQSAYPIGVPRTLPGTLELEDFDRGGPNVAYVDTTAANEGGQYRTADQVDISRDAGAGNGYVVGWTKAGEWMEYTVNLPQAGTYTLETRVAAVGAGGQFRISFNGVDKTGALSVPNTGAWNAYQAVSRTGVTLSSGIQTVRVAMVANGSSGFVGAFDSLRVIQAASGNSQSPYPSGAPWPLVGRVEMENFDLGGPGIAYADTTAANEGRQYRALDGVDITRDALAGNDHVIGWTQAGEWLEYTVQLPYTSVFRIDVRTAAAGAGGAFRVEFNGVDKTGVLSVPNTGAWNAYQLVSKTGITLTAGIYTVRVVMVSNGSSGYVGAFDWFAVNINTTIPPNSRDTLALAGATPALGDRLAGIVSSQETEQPDVAWSAVDGDRTTAWTGVAGAGGWWLAMTLDETRAIRGVEVDWLGKAVPGTQVLVSEDAVTWSPLPEEADSAVRAAYLWIVIPDTGRAAPPAIREISIKE